MKFSNILSLATLATAAPYFHSRDGSPDPLSVKLEMVGNSEVKARITNKSNAKLRLLKTGSILDNSPVEKAQITQDDQQVAFGGVHLSIAYDMLKDAAFQNIDAGETTEVSFDVAELHDLSPGGKFDISATGTISYANEGSNKLAGAVSFESNKVQAQVDGQKASLSRLAFNQKRTIIQPDCTGSNLTIIQASLKNCANLAQAAASEAKFGPEARMITFFKNANSTVRSIVAGTFEKAKNECLTSSPGVSDLYCSDRFNSCGEGVLAYTVAAASYMVYCPLFLTALPLNSGSCYAQTKSNTILHEATHLDQIKGTSDYGGYGFQFLQGLTPEQNLNHADTYAIFAQTIYAKC